MLTDGDSDAKSIFIWFAWLSKNGLRIWGIYLFSISSKKCINSRLNLSIGENKRMGCSLKLILVNWHLLIRFHIKLVFIRTTVNIIVIFNNISDEMSHNNDGKGQYLWGKVWFELISKKNLYISYTVNRAYCYNCYEPWKSHAYFILRNAKMFVLKST